MKKLLCYCLALSFVALSTSCSKEKLKPYVSKATNTSNPKSQGSASDGGSGDSGTAKTGSCHH